MLCRSDTQHVSVHERLMLGSVVNSWPASVHERLMLVSVVNSWPASVHERLVLVSVVNSWPASVHERLMLVSVVNSWPASVHERLMLVSVVNSWPASQHVLMSLTLLELFTALVVSLSLMAPHCGDQVSLWAPGGGHVHTHTHCSELAFPAVLVTLSYIVYRHDGAVCSVCLTQQFTIIMFSCTSLYILMML